MFDVYEDEISLPPDPTPPTALVKKIHLKTGETTPKPATSQNVIYTFNNFPIDKRETLNVSNYKLELSHVKRISGLCIRLKLGECARSALISSYAKEEEIRKAAEGLVQEIIQSVRIPFMVNYDSVPFLSSHSVVVLEKESALFPDAIYHCDLCSIHMSSMNQVKSHLEFPGSHVDEEERLEQRHILFNSLPKPSPKHLMAINNLILDVNKKITAKGFADSHMDKLNKFIENETEPIRILLEKMVPGKKVMLTKFGSVKTDCHTMTSDINYLLDVVNCNISDSLKILNSFYTGLRKYERESKKISEVSLIETVPLRISFVKMGFTVVLSWKNHEHLETSELIGIYSKLCSDLSILLRFVRSWASVAGLDCSSKKGCGFGSFVFDVMVIHYLQKREKLPCLKDIFGDLISKDAPDVFATYKPLLNAFSEDLNDKNKLATIQKKLKISKNWDHASLFLDFLKYTVENKTEVVQIVSKDVVLRKDTKLRIHIIQVLDPYGENIAHCSKAFQCYLINCFLISFVYFSVPRNSNGPLTKVEFYQKMVESPRKRRIREKDSNTPKIRSKLRENETPKKSKAVRPLNGSITGESPAAAESTSNNVDAEEEKRLEDLTDVLAKFQEQCKIMPTTQTEECIIFDGPQQYPKKKMIEIKMESTYELNKDVMSGIKTNRIFRLPLQQKNIENQVLPKEVDISLAEVENSDNVCFEDFFMKYDLAGVQSLNQKSKTWKVSLFSYDLENASNFNRSFCPELKCLYCDKMNHGTNNCPRLQMPSLRSYKEKTKERLSELDALILYNFNCEKISNSHQKASAQVIDTLTAVLSDYCRRDVKLELFGSMVNGFGTKGSDLDVCFVFHNSPTPPEGIAPKTMIKQIYKALVAKHKVISKITRIPMAKVPIVKFLYRHPSYDFQTDISYYNCLALHNTKLLKAYCAVEPNRLSQLGLWIKKFAKVCDIGDASKGSLSSYSYVIMLIHYLQNCEPPVLPRLQEDYRKDNTPSLIVEGWDVYFHPYVSKGGWSRNKKSVGELFLGFLDYFSSFNYNHKVIQIRRKEELLKIEKRWTKPICIEDPFDLSHNLGNVVNSKMFIHIRRCFTTARDVFNDESARASFCRNIRKNPNEKIEKDETPAFMEHILYSCVSGDAPVHNRRRQFGNNREENNKQTPRRQTHENAGQANVKENQPFTLSKRRPRNRKNNNCSALNISLNEASTTAPQA